MVLLVTQGLALTRNYHVAQSLSALHEKSAAWLGLGSAFIGMWRQRTHRAAPLDVFCILLYLSCLFALGVTTPALVNVGYADINDPLLAYMTYYLSQATTDRSVMIRFLRPLLTRPAFAALNKDFRLSACYP